MKSFLVVIACLLSATAYAETVKLEFTVQSQTNQDYDVQVMVMGVDQAKIDAVGQVVIDTMSLTASQYSKNGLLDSRNFVISRLERNLKKQKITFDGVGILSLVKKDGKILDVE